MIGWQSPSRQLPYKTRADGEVQRSYRIDWVKFLTFLLLNNVTGSILVICMDLSEPLSIIIAFT